jgi:hypothetical protein
MRQAVACWIKILRPISDRQIPRLFAAVCVCRNLNPDLLVMQPANQGVRHDAFNLLNRA